MNKKQFIQEVLEMTDLPDEATAEQTTEIVLQALSRRLTPDEAKDAEAQLPEDVKKIWDPQTTTLLPFLFHSQLRYRTPDEMYAIIDDELQSHYIPTTAGKASQAVFHVLKEQISEGEIEDIAQQLPSSIATIWLEA